ncbi:glycosyltransferase [Polynucleobacter sp. Nonnen-W13]|uniref:CgeB family protein n=1 Tax=Polynucleobacter sp. Nonnen-W13 TaxID=1855625 RepID=UPI001C0C6094|nr:glycosyltransferase [Polynucleobacter sp. Nonnen-W13]MBU3558378.1 glycosyltransferase [Polynucleobacter sp. Nonnen-W13]
MQLKKILITFVDNFLILDYLEKEFKALGIEVDIYATNNSGHWLHRYVFKKINKLAKSLGLISKDADLFEWSQFSFEKYREYEFADRIQQFKPDLILCIHGHKFGETVLKKTHIPKIGWWVEPNPNIETLIRYARLFDLYLSYDSEIVEMLNNLHIRSEYQSHVASSSDFYPIPEMTKDIDVLFYGSWSPWREEVLFAAYQATSNIALFGSDWIKKCTLFSHKELKSILWGREIVSAQLNEVISRSKVVLAAQRLNKATTGLDTRAFDVLASGALLLTDAPKDLFRHFKDREDLLVYKDSDEVPGLIKAVLKGQIEAAQIKGAGREKVMQGLTYQVLCQKISNEYSHGFNK